MSLNHLTGVLTGGQGFTLGVNAQKPVITPSVGATALVGGQSGAIIKLSTASSGMAFTLPATASSAGVEYEFVLNDSTAGANCTIASAEAGKLVGCLIVNAAKVTMTTNQTLTVVSGTATKGDQIRVRCTGDFWVVFGIGQAAGSITVA
jgi:hypothetical protein